MSTPIWEFLRLTKEQYLDMMRERSERGVGCCSVSEWVALVELVELVGPAHA